MKKVLIFLVLFCFFNHLNLWAEKNEKDKTKVEKNDLNSKKGLEEIETPNFKGFDFKEPEEIKFIGYKCSKLIHTGKEMIFNHILLDKILNDYYNKKKGLIGIYDLMFLDYNFNKRSGLSEVLEHLKIDYKEFIRRFFYLVGYDWGKNDCRIKIIWESYLGKFTPIAIEFVAQEKNF